MTTTVQDGPSPTPPTIQQDQVEAAVEGEVVSISKVLGLGGNIRVSSRFYSQDEE
jgi:hypothetical protein